MDQNSSVAESPDLITTDFPCMFCQYNLRMLSRASNCPECGQPIALNPEPRPTAWVQSVYMGLFLLPIGFVGYFLLEVSRISFIHYFYKYLNKFVFLFVFPGNLLTSLLPRIVLAITFIYAVRFLTAPKPLDPTRYRQARIFQYVSFALSFQMVFYYFLMEWMPYSTGINYIVYINSEINIIVTLLFYRLLWSQLATLPDARYPRSLGVNLRFIRTAYPLMLLIGLIPNDFLLNTFLRSYWGYPDYNYYLIVIEILNILTFCVAFWSWIIYFLLFRRVHHEGSLSILTMLHMLCTALHNRAVKFRTLLTYHGTPPDPTPPSP